MASSSKPKKTGRLRSKLQRLFSSSSSVRDDRDGEPIAQDLQAPVQDPSLPDNLRGLTPPRAPVVGTQRRYTGAPAENVASSTGASASSSMFSRARNFNVGGNIQIDSSQHVQHVHNAQDKSIDGWKMLLENITSNAFYDSGARFDPPKCDEDTRVEVISEIMDWIGDQDSPKRLLCMTGAAGAGKSALQQTIAERCADSGILGCAIFFSSQDPTRNNLSRIVPTIAFQLGQHDPTLQDCIRKAIEKDPPIFTRTIRTQMDTLVVRPFKQLQANPAFDPGSFPHVMLIDGLDECAGEERQAELLSAIKHCLLDNDLPFRIFIASRPEWAIRSALNPETRGYLYPLAYHIQLSDKYDATEDIRRYLWRRLQDIGSQSYDLRARSKSWPTVEDIEKLVLAASGQFVYAATIVKYVSERRSSPVDRLQTVVDWTPEEGRLARPFEALDVLYAGILSAAKESYEAVDTHRGRNFLLLLRAHHINSNARLGFGWCAPNFDEILSLERNAHEVLVSDLHSLVVFHQQSSLMCFYHKSFSDFLDSETRSMNLFIPEIQVKAAHVYNGSAAVALVLYSDKGNLLSGQQILALAHNDGWRKLDELVGYIIPMTKSSAFLAVIFVIMRRLKNKLNEPGLADALKPYYNKWRELVKTYFVENKMEGLLIHLPPEELEEGEMEEGQGRQEESDSSAHEVLR
ncbi:hypothetical protein EST38_g6514 [Candolleomyces aberdarensis]|uniref:Nephrocystin 3-like N-terminal domain-containing protein n=1 Tax=Candolleomyces aberdarensis TaxID=2316362 RepID=A0A4Q2DHH0_9AGAR|nr:hypothetical protein EST38_g6514 [Candolleomyces aberdarensis]